MKAWLWIKEHVKAVLGAIVGVLLFVLGAGWIWRRQKKTLLRVKDQLAVSKATVELERLRAVREEVAREVGESDQAIVEIDAKIEENRRQLAEAHEKPEDMSDEELLEELRRLGY